ncbi:MAG: hypothetical protein K6G03_04190 [Lachnospiraceae bacterium]|nr:hypothetical protein [Lachnospiraceae bacterium]
MNNRKKFIAAMTLSALISASMIAAAFATPRSAMSNGRFNSNMSAQMQSRQMQGIQTQATQSGNTDFGQGQSQDSRMMEGQMQGPQSRNAGFGQGQPQDSRMQNGQMLNGQPGMDNMQPGNMMNGSGMAFGPMSDMMNRPRNPFDGINTSGMELPTPQGESVSGPSIDRETFDETVEEGGYSQSEDYSYLYTMGNVSDTDYSKFSEYIADIESVESAVMSRLSSEGWKVILTTADLNKLLFKGESSNVVGCTCTGTKEIYVSAGEYSYCIYHELGHYIDYVLGWKSATDEFTSIYNSEKGNLTDYGQTSAEEFFAEVHMYMYLEPDTIAEKCPLAYEYVQNCVAGIS